jgi:hypothetical protein
LPLDGPEGAELLTLTAELSALAARQRTLLQRRALLVAALRARRLPLVRPPQANAQAAAPPPSAQGVLLTVGGLLLLLAGAVFTLVNWSRFGIGGRAVVLGALTCAVLAAPFPLMRRRLDSTADTARAVGLGLLLLDAYAARAAGLGGLDSLGRYGYWAAVTALVAAGAAAYGRLGPSRAVPYIALLLAQFPAPLVAAASHAHLTGAAYALLANGALDFAVAARTRLRYASGAAAGWAVAAGAAALQAGERATGYGAALTACAPLLLTAAFALVWARTERAPWRLHAATAAGLALVGAVQVMAGQALPQAWAAMGWAVPAALLAGAALVAGPVDGLRDDVERRGLFQAGAGALAVVGACELAPLLRSFTAPVVHGTWQVDGAVPAVTALCAAVAAGAAVRFGRAEVWTGVAVAGVAAAESASLAASWPYPVPLALAGALALAAAVRLLLRPAAPAAASSPWLGALLAAGGTALWWSLPDDTAALTVWGAAAALACALTAANRHPAPAGAFAVGALTIEAIRATTTADLPLYTAAFPVLAVAAATIPATVWLTSTAAAALRARPADPAPSDGSGPRTPEEATPASAPSDGAGTPPPLGPHPAAAEPTTGRPATPTAPPGPAPAAPDGPGAAVPPRPTYVPGLGFGRPVPVKAVRTAPLSPALAVEAGGYLAGLLALCLGAGDADVLSLVLALAGAAAGLVALRAERRRAGALAAAVLVAASSWVRLGLAGVHAPEAYTVSASCVLLGVGWVRRRRQPGVGSYEAYASGLAVTLGPSLVAAWGDPRWERPLLLGLGALAVTLLGAHHRLRAPLLLGGGVLLADAVHELAPTVVQSLGLLPRWVPVALAGALLVYVGATYERRLVDARRVRRGYRALR